MALEIAKVNTELFISQTALDAGKLMAETMGQEHELEYHVVQEIAKMMSTGMQLNINTEVKFQEVMKAIVDLAKEVNRTWALSSDHKADMLALQKTLDRMVECWGTES